MSIPIAAVERSSLEIAIILEQWLLGIILNLWLLGVVAIVPLVIGLFFRKTSRWSQLLLTIDLLGLWGTHLALQLAPNPKQTSARDKCVNQLRQIGAACQMYSRDHGGAFPTSWVSLSTYDFSPEMFVCPASQTKRGSIENVDHWTDYILATNLTATSSSDRVLAYCKPTNHMNSNGTSILFVDGSALFFSAGYFEKLPCDVTRHSRMNSRPRQGAAPLHPGPGGPSDAAR